MVVFDEDELIRVMGEVHHAADKDIKDISVGCRARR